MVWISFGDLQQIWVLSNPCGGFLAWDLLACGANRDATNLVVNAHSRAGNRVHFGGLSVNFENGGGDLYGRSFPRLREWLKKKKNKKEQQKLKSCFQLFLAPFCDQK